MSSPPNPTSAHGDAQVSDRVFWIGFSILGGSYVFLIVALLLGDLLFTTPGHLAQALRSQEIRYAIKLSLISCTITTILAMWVAVPLGYLLSRTHFAGKGAVDTLLDVPIVLPPLVIGLSLLILFQTWPGRMIEESTSKHLGFVVSYIMLPTIAAGLAIAFTPAPTRFIRLSAGALAAVCIVAGLALSSAGSSIATLLQQHLGTRITYAIPSVIIAQFSVATAFAVRTMRVTFDQISPRTEQVALTLGCTRWQAFWFVALPEARRGMVTAGTLAWARSLGEFGPILVFAGATRMKTEVLSTTVFLELSVGNLYAAIAVSLLMVIVAVVVLVLARGFGLKGVGVN
jgi:molybdate transport system permease protein